MMPSMLTLTLGVNVTSTVTIIMSLPSINTSINAAVDSQCEHSLRAGGVCNSQSRDPESDEGIFWNFTEVNKDGIVY